MDVWQPCIDAVYVRRAMYRLAWLVILSEVERKYRRCWGPHL